MTERDVNRLRIKTAVKGLRRFLAENKAEVARFRRTRIGSARYLLAHTKDGRLAAIYVEMAA
jgi:hypothetical protein